MPSAPIGLRTLEAVAPAVIPSYTWVMMSSRSNACVLSSLLFIFVLASCQTDDTNERDSSVTPSEPVVYAVGYGGVLAYADGGWDSVLSGYQLTAVWGSDPSNVFVVGANGQIVHYDGAAWSEMASGTSQLLNAVWGAGPNDVYAVGGTDLMHYDGERWTRLDVVVSSDDGDFFGFEGVWGSGPSDVYVLGSYSAECVCEEIHHFDGTEWTIVGSGSSLAWKSIWGSGPANVFTVGEFSSVSHFDGSEWTDEELPARPLSTFHAVWGSGPGDVFAFHNDQPHIWHHDGQNWASMNTPESPLTGFESAGIFGTASDRVFAVAGDSIYTFDGQSWSRTDIGTTGVDLRGVWAAPNTN